MNATVLQCGSGQFRLGGFIMGVVNVTPDSFSDGGCWYDPDKAIAHGLALAEQAQTFWMWAASPRGRGGSGHA